jgi:hypothetical protein
MRNGYVYYAQSKEHPSDPFYARVFGDRNRLLNWIAGSEDEFIVFRYDTDDNTCKVIDLR